MKGFTFIHENREICEFLPLSSELQQKNNSELDSFTIGMAYSNMNLINTSLIAAYDIGGTEEYEKILKIYAPYVDAMAQTELVFMNVLPNTVKENSGKIDISNHEDLVNFLSNPNWICICESIKNTITKISEKIIDDHPLKKGLMLRDLSKTASSIIIPNLHWYEKPIATLPIAALILEKQHKHGRLHGSSEKFRYSINCYKSRHSSCKEKVCPCHCHISHNTSNEL